MQSPFLFAGSVADNLSPLGTHTDAQLWQALEHVQLKPLVASFDAGLQTAVADGGTSLSVGEPNPNPSLNPHPNPNPNPHPSPSLNPNPNPNPNLVAVGHARHEVV